MKRLFLAILLVFLLPSLSWAAASTMVETSATSPDSTKPGGIIIWTCTADSATAAFTTTTSTYNLYGYITRVVTNPGATAPTANYDLTITDSDGIDLVGGALMNRSATASEEVVAKWSDQGVFGGKKVHGPIILTFTNNAVNSAIVVVTVYYDGIYQ